MKLLKVYVDSETVANVEKLSKKADRTKSSYIRQLIKKDIDKNTDNYKERR